MKMFAAALLAVLAPFALAAPANHDGVTYKIPFNGDGVFRATVDANGNVTSTRLQDLSVGAKLERDVQLGKRYPPLPISSHECMAYHPNFGDFNLAVAEFGLFCDQGNPVLDSQTEMLYVAIGSTVAFGCSWSGGSQPCSTAEYRYFLRYMTDNCGSFRGGYADMVSWKKQYGVQLRGEVTCGKWIS